jgi:hypothetical protein
MTFVLKGKPDAATISEKNIYLRIYGKPCGSFVLMVAGEQPAILKPQSDQP